MTQASMIGPKVLLMAPSGTGKTFSLGTLVEWAQANDKQVFALFTENGLETLLGYWRDTKCAPFNRAEPAEIPSCLHWHNALTRPIALAGLMKAAEDVGKFSYKQVTEMVDPKRADNNSFFKILASCANFPDDRTGESFGSVDSWDSSKIFIIDSLSELANACMKMVIGAKPTASQPDYGVAQNNLMNFLRLCTQGIGATFILTAHVDRQTEEISGQTKTMVKAIGKALAGDIPQLFSDVIYAEREADKFFWNTAAYGVDTKTRSLGYRSKITPDFRLIMDVWKQRGEGK